MAATAAELRAEIARMQVRKYQLAGLVGIHPSVLGPMLNERILLPAEVADRIERALRHMAAGNASRTAGGKVVNDACDG